MNSEKKNTGEASAAASDGENGKGNKNDRRKWVTSLEHLLEHILKNEQSEQASLLLEDLNDRLRESGLKIPQTVSTPYINTIAPDNEPPYPGNREIERRIKSYIRWNAMAMVVKANRIHPDIGGHISTYASAATLYEVGFNHFFRGGDGDHHSDMIYFQGHASPGAYSRAYVEWRINAPKLHHFRQELSPVGGVSSYPHPYLMPDFWQFPSVSMGLAPIMSIYQARFVRYLKSRGLISGDEPRVW
jgi:pyruvate dehydrogenase E1 component